MLLEFISLVYGQLIIRFCGLGCRMSSAVTGLRIHACGLSTATALKRAHSWPTRLPWSVTDSPFAIRSACSNIGYT